MNRAALAVAVVLSLTTCGAPAPPSEPPDDELVVNVEPEAPPVDTTALRSAIREARKAVRHPDASYAGAIFFAGQAIKESEAGRLAAYEATLRASEASSDASAALTRHRDESNKISDERDQINTRFIRNERDFAVRQDDLDALSIRQTSLDEELAAAVEARRAAYQSASDEWSRLLPEALHSYAASKAAQSVGRNDGWFGEIDDVYSWFMRHSARLSPTSTPVDQRRVYDYGVAMKFYFDLNPIGEHEEEYAEWHRAVDTRLETLGWKDGVPKFSRLTF